MGLDRSAIDSFHARAVPWCRVIALFECRYTNDKERTEPTRNFMLRFRNCQMFEHWCRERVDLAREGFPRNGARPSTSLPALPLTAQHARPPARAPARPIVAGAPLLARGCVGQSRQTLVVLMPRAVAGRFESLVKGRAGTMTALPQVRPRRSPARATRTRGGGACPERTRLEKTANSLPLLPAVAPLKGAFPQSNSLRRFHSSPSKQPSSPLPGAKRSHAPLRVCPAPLAAPCPRQPRAFFPFFYPHARPPTRRE